MFDSRRRCRPIPPWPLLGFAVFLLATADASAQLPERDLSSEIDTLRAAVAASTLDESQRETANAQLDAAALDLREAKSLDEQAAALSALAATPLKTSRREAPSGDLHRDRAIEDWTERPPADADIETLEDALQQQRNTISERTEEIERVEAALARNLARPAEIVSEIAALGRTVEELSTPPETAAEAPELIRNAQTVRRASELRRAQAELELKRVEQKTSLPRQRLRESQLEELRLRQTRDLQRAEWLQTRIAEDARGELERAVDRLIGPPSARTTTTAAAPGEPSAAGTEAHGGSFLARQNRELADELLTQNSRLEKDRERIVEEEQARDRVLNALRESRTRLALGGSSEAVGRWLWSERRRLERSVRLADELEDRRSDLAELRLRLVTLSEELRDLDDLPAAAKALGEARELRAAEEGKVVDVEGSLEPALETRVELIKLLEPILERRVKALEQRELALQEHLEATQAMRELLDRYLLWTPSHAPVDSTWLERAPEGLSDLVKASRWATTFRLTKKELGRRPVLWAGCLLLLVGLLELRRRAPEQIRSGADAVRASDADEIGETLLVFAWTLLAALPVPALFAALGELFQAVGSAGRYSDSVGRALMSLVGPLLALQAMRWAVLEGGLADAHFGWTPARRTALRRALTPATLIVIPMYYVISLSFIRNLELPNDVQARVAVVVACLMLAWTFWRLLDLGEAWSHRGGDQSPPSTLRRLLRVALPLSILVIAILSLTGYVYTAGLLLEAVLMSVCLVVALSLGLGLLARWLLIGERRLARRRAAEQRADAEGPGNASSSAQESDDAEADDLSLEEVNAQTRRLLMVLRVSLLFFGFLWVWAEVLPAITRLDEITLWSFNDVAPDGMPITRPVTLMGALFGLVALALTIVGSRNLPGLVELGLLSQTSIDAASRYAITSLLRYAIVIAGTVIGLELLGMRWSQLQWLAAALTVGLGFGLQEIFANFVSGLILLFERPFRVGDVITVDTLTGRVTRIRTRATTILDFDNREIVVPNKNFITGQLLNWTLSDTSTRISIKVGVAYGTDPDRVHRLLLEVADANPLVQRDPEPCSWFLAFGASSLDFELRFFVSALADRLKVQSEIHREIARSFAEHDIEIAFPQMDLHVRDLPEQQTLARAT